MINVAQPFDKKIINQRIYRFKAVELNKRYSDKNMGCSLFVICHLDLVVLRMALATRFEELVALFIKKAINLT